MLTYICNSINIYTIYYITYAYAIVLQICNVTYYTCNSVCIQYHILYI